MITGPPGKFVLWLSIPLSMLLVITSCVGIFTPEFYASETLNWQTQAIGQDLVDLIVVMPCLFITSWLAAMNNRSAFLLWGGVMMYLAYTFVIFCFDVHFNRLFILYCIELGLSVYGCLLFLFALGKEGIRRVEGSNGIFRLTGIYFITVALLFYILWLSEILPSVWKNVSPAILEEAGLFTNPVHVLDLSLVLPGIFITGILILKKNNFGFMLAPAVLMFFILMNLTICFLMLMMNHNGLQGNPAIAFIMAALAIFSFTILILFFKRSKSLFKLMEK